MAKNDKAKDQKQKGKPGAGDEGGRSKGKGKGKGPAEEPAPYASIATHPRAHASVKRARAWTGLIAFALAALLSLKAQVPIELVGLRALAAGWAGYLFAWWASMKIWRHLMIAEQKAAIEEINRRREKALAEAGASG